jgi:hypothetical protein
MTRDEIREQARQAITNTAGGRGYDERLEDSVTEFALSLVRRRGGAMTNYYTARIYTDRPGHQPEAIYHRHLFHVLLGELAAYGIKGQFHVLKIEITRDAEAPNA